MDKLEVLNSILNFGIGWSIKAVLVNKTTKEVDIYLEYTLDTCFYSEEESVCVIYDFTKSRRIRHLDMFDYKTFLNFRTPRAKLSTGDSRAIPLNFSDARVSFSYDFEIKVIECLELCKNQSQTAHYLQTSFEIVHHIMERAVNRGLSRRSLDGINTLSLDEKSYSNGHNYFTVLSDPINKRVLDIIDGRSSDATQELLQNTLTTKQLDGISWVTMDMWKPYINSVNELLPSADIVHDKFHIAKYLNKGVDEVRKSEAKENKELKHSKYLLLKNKENWTECQKIKFQEINEINLKTADAWRMKENFKEIYNCWTPSNCLSFFKDWYINVVDSEIKQMVSVADTLLRNLGGIVNAALSKLSNSMAENLNSKIQIVKSVARGYRNISAYRNAILFFNGNLELAPLKKQ
jgi:transposase